MTTLWEVRDLLNIKKVECESCQSIDDIYNLDNELICRKCLESTEAEDFQNNYLTIVERNK